MTELKRIRGYNYPRVQLNKTSVYPRSIRYAHRMHLKNELKETIYSPDSMWRLGIVRVCLLTWRELWTARELVFRLVYRDISVRYRQSILGYVWAVFPQIATVSIFAFLASRRVFPMGETPIPYVAFALWNLSVWQLFSGCLIGSTNSLARAGSLVTKINFPKQTLVISSIGQALFDFAIRLIPVSAVFAWYGIVPPSQALAIPLILIPMMLMALGLGLMFSIANLIIRDIANALSMALTFGMFLAPILYPPPVQEPFVLVNTINPFSPLLIATQNLLSTGQIVNIQPLLVTTGFALGIFFLGSYVFHVTLPRIAERA